MNCSTKYIILFTIFALFLDEVASGQVMYKDVGTQKEKVSYSEFFNRIREVSASNQPEIVIRNLDVDMFLDKGDSVLWEKNPKTGLRITHPPRMLGFKSDKDLIIQGCKFSNWIINFDSCEIGNLAFVKCEFGLSPNSYHSKIRGLVFLSTTTGWAP